MSLDKLISDKSPIEGSVIRENVNSKFIIFAKNIFPSVITNMATMHKSQRFAILQSAFQSALDVQKVEAKGKGKERARPVSPLFPEEMDDSLVPHRKKNVAQSSFFSRGASSSTSSSSYVSVSTRVEICKRDLDDLEQYFNAMLRNPSTSATVFYQQIEAAHALLSKLIAFFESEQQLSSRGLLPSCLAEFIVLKIPNGRYS